MMFIERFRWFLVVVSIAVLAMGSPQSWAQESNGNGMPDEGEIPAPPAINATPTVTPTPAVTPGPAGYALYFDGGDYVYLGTDSRLNPQDQYTIEAWVKPATTEAYGAVFARMNIAANCLSYWLGLEDAYLFRCGLPPVEVPSLDPPGANVWTHLAGVHDAGTVRLYRNGIFQGELSGDVNDQFDIPTLIGADYTWGSVWHHWQGWIDEVRFWSTARSSYDIKHWMDYSLEGSPPGLTGYWDFDDGAGQTALDRGPNGLHGILGESAEPGDDDPTWVVSDAPMLAGAPPPTSQDCDGNGISDPVQIAASPEFDCNMNGILDLCETGGYASPPVAQDICQFARWLCPGEAYYSSTVGMGNEGGIVGSCGNSDTAPDVWFVYVPDSDGLVSISTCGLFYYGYSSVLAIYDGCPDAGGIELACEYWYPCNLGSGAKIEDFPVLGGETYYIRVAGRDGRAGDFRILLSGPQCITNDCDGSGVPDDCEASPCPSGVLCYDDGDGAADTVVNESLPGSFLVKFTVPNTFTGLRQVAKVTWYPGSGTIENPRAVVRGDLSGGFGTAQNCIVEDVTSVVPNTFNEVDLRQNLKEFLVQPGDVFYAGLFGSKMSLGADIAASTVLMTDMVIFDAQSADPCTELILPWPTVAPTHSIPCWNKRNYKLDQAGIHYPTDQLEIAPLDSVECQYERETYFHSWFTCTTMGWCGWTGTFQVWCKVICSQPFRIEGQNWLIRASLAGTFSPELASGCYDRVDPNYTPRPTKTVTPTPTATSTPTVTSTCSVTPTGTPTFAPVPEYDDPVLVAELNSDGGDAYPHLTGDLLEMFFVSDRTGDTDIWSATRESIEGAWNPPFPVTELNSTSIDTCPAVSADGLEIFFSSQRDLAPTNNFNRVYRSTRPDRSSPWSVPVEVPELRPPQVDNHYCSPSYLSEDGLRIYTHRRFGSDFDLYVSARADSGSPFSGPTPLPGNVNTGSYEAHMGLSGDELTMIFGRVTGAWNLFGAKRSTPTGAFQVLREMTELNDPTCGTQTGCVSSDMIWIWFSSDRPECPGLHDIYVAKLLQTSTPTVTPTATATPTRSTGVNMPLWRFR